MPNVSGTTNFNRTRLYVSESNGGYNTAPPGIEIPQLKKVSVTIFSVAGMTFKSQFLSRNHLWTTSHADQGSNC